VRQIMIVENNWFVVFEDAMRTIDGPCRSG